MTPMYPYFRISHMSVIIYCDSLCLLVSNITDIVWHENQTKQLKALLVFMVHVIILLTVTLCILSSISISIMETVWLCLYCWVFVISIWCQHLFVQCKYLIDSVSGLHILSFNSPIIEINLCIITIESNDLKNISYSIIQLLSIPYLNYTDQ